MKMILSLLVAFTVSSIAKADSGNCSNCKTIRELEMDILKLNYSNPDDNQKGYDSLDKVFALIEKFRGSKAKDRKVEFRALVNLVSAALPYDPESAGASQIESLISAPSDLKPVYQDTLVKITDSCRKQLLSAMVESHACVRQKGSDATSCIPPAGL